MRTLILASLLAMLATACGPEVGGRTALTLELPAFSSSDVLKIYALSQDLTGGGKLSCSMLETEQVSFGDANVEILAETSGRGGDLEAGQVTLTLDEIPAGENRIFAAEVVDLNAGTRKGFGCTPNVEVVANQLIEVRITVREL